MMPKIFEGKKTVSTSIKIPEDLVEKIRIVKGFYKGSVSVYVVSLIEKDLAENGDKYREKLNF